MLCAPHCATHPHPSTSANAEDFKISGGIAAQLGSCTRIPPQETPRQARAAVMVSLASLEAPPPVTSTGCTATRGFACHARIRPGAASPPHRKTQPTPVAARRSNPLGFQLALSCPQPPGHVSWPHLAGACTTRRMRTRREPATPQYRPCAKATRPSVCIGLFPCMRQKRPAMALGRTLNVFIRASIARLQAASREHLFARATGARISMTSAKRVRRCCSVETTPDCPNGDLGVIARCSQKPPRERRLTGRREMSAVGPDPPRRRPAYNATPRDTLDRCSYFLSMPDILESGSR